MLFGATLIWGLSYSIQAILAEDLGPFTVVFFKGAGGIILLPFIIKDRRVLDKGTIIDGMIIGAVAFLGCIFQQLGIVNSTVSKASFITTLYIIFVPLIERLSGKKIPRKIIISVCIALAGLYFLCFSGNETFGIGDFYLLLCSVCFALQIIRIDKATRKHDPLSIIFVSQIATALYSAIFMIAKERPSLEALGSSLIPLIYITFIAGLFAQSLQITFQKDTGPSLASLIMSFESVFGALFGWIVLSQSLTGKEIFGCVLVFIAIIIAES